MRLGAVPAIVAGNASHPLCSGHQRGLDAGSWLQSLRASTRAPSAHGVGGVADALRFCRRANLVIQCENWWSLAKQFASRSPPLHFLSSPVQRTLMKALVLGGFAHMDSETKQQYWTEVTAPLPSRRPVGHHGPAAFPPDEPWKLSVSQTSSHGCPYLPMR